jgi:LuxR family transcriptional regulator, regulator of acetate metabolism
VRRRPEPVRREPHRRLTPRQLEVVDLIASGLPTAEIARGLAISPETVRNHLRNASRELGAHNRVEAIATARRLGLLAAPALGPQTTT